MLQLLRGLQCSLVFTFRHKPGIPSSVLFRPLPFPQTKKPVTLETPSHVVFAMAHKALMIKPALGVTTSPAYNELEGDRNQKRWDAYKKREESGKTNDELHL